MRWIFLFLAATGGLLAAEADLDSARVTKSLQPPSSPPLPRTTEFEC